ncbi:dipeptidase PepE [Auritidibacter sp. NML130574]|uniref:dipeptidase PepE n=1 Tax=Auritidibacter sp. NML130574 TaxID=2170745 RepID=UPI001AEFF081|nr:dipeptidase PepE [Auritidibacter sp. NML130574]
MPRALLMSSSRKDSLGYLEHSRDQLYTILEGTSRKVLFIPYAAVSFSYDTYEELASAPFATVGADLVSIHRYRDPVAAVHDADIIAVGGGNSFALLSRLYEAELLSEIRDRVVNYDASYIGWSAGTNVATPSIRTTNDMPIVQPPTFSALSIVPFQINPHFVSGKPAGHNGESREERLAEFTAINPNEEVLALPEGSALYVTECQGEILGDRSALVFSNGADARRITVESPFNLSEISGRVV